MDIYTASEARSKLYKLIDSVSDSHDPICITGKRNKVIVMSDEDYKAIQETLFLLSIQGMRESIIQARKESVEQFLDKLDW